MTKQNLALRVLVALYRSASRGHFHTESSLAGALALEPASVRQLLAALDRAGFVQGPELRLTLPGLAVAVAAAKKQKPAALARAA